MEGPHSGETAVGITVVPVPGKYAVVRLAITSCSIVQHHPIRSAHQTDEITHYS